MEPTEAEGQDDVLLLLSHVRDFVLLNLTEFNHDYRSTSVSSVCYAFCATKKKKSKMSAWG